VMPKTCPHVYGVHKVTPSVLNCFL